MYKQLASSGAISLASLILSQLIRFGSNLVLARLLAPDAFGLVAIVNTVLVGIALFSDIGLRQVVVQKQGELTAEFLNTIWIVQIIRGIGIFVISVLIAAILYALQLYSAIPANAYGNPMLPFLIAGAALSAVFSGFESTKTHIQYRTLTLGRVLAIELAAQLSAAILMVTIALVTRSAWALVAGGVIAALVKSLLGHLVLVGHKNAFYFDRATAVSILRKGRWILLSSPLTFLELHGAVMLLGALISSASLGVYMIASLLVGVVYMVSQNLSSNVFFPGLCVALRNGPGELRRAYLHFQLIADAIIVTSAGGLIGGGKAIVAMLFDQRYAAAGGLLSSLAIGLIGVRYSVVEQLINAKGDFKLGPPTILSRLVSLGIGITVGNYYGGPQGAAIGVGLSWFAGWPILIWYRSNAIPNTWRSEGFAFCFLSAGYGLGVLFSELVSRFHLQLIRH